MVPWGTGGEGWGGNDEGGEGGTGAGRPRRRARRELRGAGGSSTHDCLGGGFAAIADTCNC